MERLLDEVGFGVLLKSFVLDGTGHEENTNRRPKSANAVGQLRATHLRKIVVCHEQIDLGRGIRRDLEGFGWMKSEQNVIAEAAKHGGHHFTHFGLIFYDEDRFVPTNILGHHNHQAATRKMSREPLPTVGRI